MMAMSTGGGAGPGPVRVAIVDDDRRYAEALADLIGLSEHFIVVGVADGVDAGCDLFGRTDTELALVDVNMADGGGRAVVQRLRAWLERPMLVLISAQAPPGDLDEEVPFVAKDRLDTDRLWSLWRERRR